LPLRRFAFFLLFDCLDLKLTGFPIYFRH
jgi:hypothetical protein